MGTQQILMIVLSVIVVGVAVGIGIQMFDNQSKIQTRGACQADLLQFGIGVQAYFRTPTTMGGGGCEFDSSADLVQMMRFINGGNEATTVTTPNGSYVFSATSDEGVSINLATIPSINGWKASGVVAFDGRTDTHFARGVWTYVGPIDTAPTPPTL